MRWSTGLAASIGFHLALLGTLFLLPKVSLPEDEPTKVTWINLPSAGGPAGGAGIQEQGDPGERVRRVEEQAPESNDERKGAATPDAFSAESRKSAVKGTSKNPDSMGQAKTPAKGAQATPNPTKGTAGAGAGGGAGAGYGIPGLKAAQGAMGGSGLIDGVDGDFPYTWYLTTVQNRITGNWNRFNRTPQRVQIYFRIKRDGSIEGERIESPSLDGSFDQGALLAVKRSNPLPALPPEYPGKVLGVRFWFTGP